MKKSVHQNPKKYWWNRKSHDHTHRLQMIYRTFVRVISYKTQHFAKKIIDKQLCSPINKHLSAFVNFKKHLAQNQRRTYFKIVEKSHYELFTEQIRSKKSAKAVNLSNSSITNCANERKKEGPTPPWFDASPDATRRRHHLDAKTENHW